MIFARAGYFTEAWTTEDPIRAEYAILAAQQVRQTSQSQGGSDEKRDR